MPSASGNVRKLLWTRWRSLLPFLQLVPASWRHMRANSGTTTLLDLKLLASSFNSNTPTPFSSADAPLGATTTVHLNDIARK